LFNCGKAKKFILPTGITFFIPQTPTANNNRFSFLKNLKVINRCGDYGITWAENFTKGVGSGGCMRRNYFC
jgi:hypothetical protein